MDFRVSDVAILILSLHEQKHHQDYYASLVMTNYLIQFEINLDRTLKLLIETVIM